MLGISYEEKKQEKRDEICKRNKARLLITVIKTQLAKEKTEYIVVYFSSQNWSNKLSRWKHEIKVAHAHTATALHAISFYKQH